MISHEPRPGATDVLLSYRFRTLSLLLLAGAVAACGRVPGQFEILQDQVPAAGCAIDTNRTVYRGEGYLDLSLVRAGAQSAYFLFPLVINNLPGSTSGSADANEIDLHSFAVDIGTTAQSYLPPNVEMLFSTLNSKPGTTDYALLHYSLPWSGTISSGGGLAATFVSGFPVELAQRVLATGDIGISSTSMIVNIQTRVFGTTNTQNMESDPFDFPVHVCNGCLVGNVFSCPFAGAINTGNPCNVAQDESVDCCSVNGQLICPAVGTSQ